LPLSPQVRAPALAVVTELLAILGIVGERVVVLRRVLDLVLRPVDVDLILRGVDPLDRTGRQHHLPAEDPRPSVNHQVRRPGFVGRFVDTTNVTVNCTRAWKYPPCLLCGRPAPTIPTLGRNNDPRQWGSHGCIRLVILLVSSMFAALLLVPAAALALTPVTFTGPTNFAVGDGPNSVAVGDFNGDGDPDLAVANEFAGSVSVLLGGAGGSFSAATNIATGGFPFAVAVGEFNGDGDPDLAVADQSPGEIMVLLGSTGGTFTGPTILTTDSGVSAVAVADFNRDGDPDLAVTNVNQSRVSVLLGDTGATFTAQTNFAVGSTQTSVVAADFNGDGKPDLAATKFNTDNVAVLLNSTVTNQAPVATGDAYSTAEDTVLTVPARGVLGNDADPDGDPLTAVLVTGPSHGSLTLNANGSFCYTPAADFAGTDSFTYRASDGTLTSNPATVTISVTAVNDPPTAAGEAYSTAEAAIP
jgi:VCBS repeat-containing protein